LALMAVQYLLHVHQLRALEREIGEVATSVGENLIKKTVWFVSASDEAREIGRRIERRVLGSEAIQTSDVHLMTVVAPGSELEILAEPDEVSPPGEFATGEGGVVLKTARTWRWTSTGDGGAGDPSGQELHGLLTQELEHQEGLIHIKVEAVVGDPDHMLVITDEAGEEERIPIPVSPTVQVVRRTMSQGLLASGALLLVGLTAAGVLSRRVTRPIRQLVSGAEAVGRGELGIQVPVVSAGEVGELEAAFNDMSLRLADLEMERERWRAREHLAQLGDLARGLGHTLRNPLNTLGLAVEELASGDAPDSDRLVTLARGQIRRIDRWLRSFLALGAGEEAQDELVDLEGLVQSVALEAIQQGARVRSVGPATSVTVRAVPGALRAALANLIENAVDASPAGGEVVVTVASEGASAVVRVEDEGDGLPEEVRDRLFKPHLTTKVGGSGMGLFLARELVVSMHGGSLELADGVDGGTVATIRLPRTPDLAGEQG